MKKMVLFGAGKIGRSFIGQLFARAGYEVVFVDVIRSVVNALNERRGYEVVIKSPWEDSVIHVENVRGVLADDTAQVAEELAGCDIAAVSAGRKGLPQTASLIAAGLALRKERYGLRPLDVILAENMRDASSYVRSLIAGNLPPDFPTDLLVGLIETSIGKMVPIMPAAVQEKDLLLVYAEPYNTLILDKKAFLNGVPEVDGLAPKDNIKAWVDRKSYIHNFGHAAAAYTGYRAFPDAVYLYEVLEDEVIRSSVRDAMLQSAAILMRKYPGEFTPEQLSDHIGDLILRFRNRALGDTVYRVGCDLKRKLHKADRVLGPLLDGVGCGMPVERIVRVFVDGLGFHGADENGKMFPDDVSFANILQNEGPDHVLRHVCGLDVSIGTDAQAVRIINDELKSLS